MSTQNVNTTSNVAAENGEFYDRTLLTRLKGALHFLKYGQKRSIKKNSGKTIHFRRFNSLTPPEGALEEGVTPKGNTISVTDVEATVQQYGDYVTVSDELQETGLDPVITEMAEVLGEQAAEKIDNVIKDEIFNGTNVQYAGNADTRENVTAVLTGAEIKKAVRTLRTGKAKPYNGYYIGFIDPACSFDLLNDPLWQDVSKYSNKENIEKGEIGKLHGVKFVDNTNAFIDSDVHGTLIIGQESYGVVDVEGSRKPRIIIKKAKDGGSADPLEQRNTVGWKAYFTAKRLQELAMVRIESAVSE